MTGVVRRSWALVLAVALAGCQSPTDTRKTEDVVRDTLAITVDVQGTMRAVDSNRVGPPAIAGVWSYKIAMMAPEGSVAEEGKPILMFDTTELKRKLESKVAERDSADTQLKMKLAAARMAREDEGLAMSEAKAELRKAKLKAEAPADLTAVVELEKAKLDLRLAREKVEYLRRKAKNAKRADQADIKRWRSKRDRARTRVEEITAAVQQMTVASPRTGTVIYQTNWRGEKKKVGDSAWRAETLMQIASLEQMEGGGEIDEVDVSRVSAEQPVSLRLDAQADVEVRGTVQKISDAVQRASPENPLKVAHVVVTIADGQDVKLRPGMRFRGKIETARLTDVVLAPLNAIVSTPEGPIAKRRSGMGTEDVSVTLGQRNATHVEVLDGLEPGDELIVVGEEAP